MSVEHKREVHSKNVAKKQGNNPTTDEYSFTVPSDKTLRLVRFSGGHEDASHEVRIELLWDDAIIACGYGSCFEYFIDLDCVGNGSRELIIRHVNGEPSELHMSAWWVGELY